MSSRMQLTATLNPCGALKGVLFDINMYRRRGRISEQRTESYGRDMSGFLRSHYSWKIDEGCGCQDEGKDT